ncbi:MAG: RNA methyltransferase [Pseudomonadota bacterium]
MNGSPSIILIRPQMGENIGAAARAMANFGLRDLRLVAPRDGWPNVKASDMAGKALPIIDDASIYEDTHASVADRQFVLATTARERSMSLPVLEMREAMVQLRARAAAGQRCAVMFGPERTGLENEDIALADAVVTIPVAPEYSSLNVAQAVVVCCYEWFQGVATDVSTQNAAEVPPATRDHLLGLLGQLEASLDDVNFWRVPEKKDVMWRNIRTTLVRAGLSEQEIATWRGVVKALRS